MANLAIIPARGGSKRIPRKNIKDFLGKPIIAYSLEASLKSCLFDEVMVSTDDEQIAIVAKEYGGKIPFMRSKAASNDYATTYDVIEEVVKEYAKKGQFFENICCIYPCAPFVNSDILRNSYQILIENSCESVFPIVAYSFPIQRSFKIEDGKVKYLYSEYAFTRSQDLEQTYHDAGQFYWLKTDSVLSEKSLLTKNTGYIEIDELEVQDIDNDIDWKLAELKYELLQKTK